MGVSIHYKGRLDDMVLLPVLCDEIRDIADSMNVSAILLDDDWSQVPDATLTAGGRIEGHLGLKGIQITPHADAGSLALFFDKDGYLRCPMTMLSILDGTLHPQEAWLSIKTQFAGVDTHVWVIGLLKYIKKHYISDLEVSDEGEYWETGDRQTLGNHITLLDGKLAEISTAIESLRMGDLANLSADEIASRIEQLFCKDEGPMSREGRSDQQE